MDLLAMNCFDEKYCIVIVDSFRNIVIFEVCYGRPTYVCVGDQYDYSMM